MCNFKGVEVIATAISLRTNHRFTELLVAQVLGNVASNEHAAVQVQVPAHKEQTRTRIVDGTLGLQRPRMAH